MKKITLLTALLLNVLIFGQPVLNALDFNPTNNSANVFSATSTTAGTGLAGANINWDFSSLITVPLGVSSNVSVSTAPLAISFQNANFFVKSITPNSNTFGYYKLTNFNLENIGASNNIEITNYFTNPQTTFTFPYSYGTSFTDTYQTTYGQQVFVTSTYDAYGTLTTPYGTYVNLFRSKRIENTGLSTYIWYMLNPFQIIFSASKNQNSGTTSYTMYQPTNLATTQNQLNNQFSIFPNPTNGEFIIKNVDFTNNEFFINVYDILGNQIIKNEKVDSDSKNINISDFATGLYFVKLVDNNNSILYTDKIIKK